MTKDMRTLILLSLIFLLTSSTELLTGKVVKVQDGDTITVLTGDNKQIKIRLDGIDAPEGGQDYGNKAKQYLSDLVIGKTIKVEDMGKDIYKRTLGVVYLNDLNVNEEMIRAGYAWRYKYNKNARYLKLQEDAKNNKRGLWAGENPIDPWQFRKNKK